MTRRTSAGSWILLALMVVAALVASLLGGCGSGAPPNNNFQGSYRSEYAISGSTETGVFSFSVSQKGSMIGSFVNSLNNATESFSGSIANSGVFSGTVTSGTSSFPLTGTLNVVSGSGSIPGGDFSETISGANVRGSFSLVSTGLTPTPTPTPNPTAQNSYTGAYSGTYSLPVNNQSGTVSFTIDTAGNMEGFLSQTSTDPVENFTGTINAAGNFSLKVTVGTGTANVGTITGTLAKSTVSTSSMAGNFVINVSSSQITNIPTGNVSGSWQVTIGGAETNSDYQGTYYGNFVTTSPISDSTGSALGYAPTLTFTVDKEGNLLGTVTGVRSVGGSIVNLSITGVITNDGRVAGSLMGATSTTAVYGVTGKVAPGTSSGTTGQTTNAAPLTGNLTLTPQTGAAISATIRLSSSTSTFIGSYADPSSLGAFQITTANVLPNSAGYFIQNGNSDLSVSISIDGEGNVIGTLGGLNVTMFATNDGQFQGTIGGYPVYGNLSKQDVPAYTNPGSSTESYSPGISANFVLTTPTQQVNGYFFGIGGSTT